MKKYLILMFLLSVTVGASAQLTIKTGNGKTVEINFNGEPIEVIVVNDSIILRAKPNKVEAATEDSLQLPTPAEFSAGANELSSDTAVVAPDSLKLKNFMTNSGQTVLGALANSLAEELSPEYAQFNAEHAGTKPASERELVKNVAKEFVNKDVVETADFLTMLFGGLRLTKDTTFVPKYEQRKPKKSTRAYNIIELEGHLGKNINGVSDVAASQVNIEDYGDDTTDEQKYGGGGKFSRVNVLGTVDSEGNWHPNPVGFAWSWGFLATYSYEKDKGSYFNGFGKLGVQVGHDISFGVDGLLGCGVIPYNTFYTNGIHHSVLNKSAFCLKYGVQLWGSLNFSGDTYTAIYGRYVRAVKPSSGLGNLPNEWVTVLEDIDPSDWTVGLAVGYKFGAPEELSHDKRLQASITTGYQLTRQKGIILATELERITQLSLSTNFSCGLSVERLFEQDCDKDKYSSVLCSFGLQVKQPDRKWFWGAKLYGGVGDYRVTFTGESQDMSMESFSKKLCGIGALQLNTGLVLGKCSEIFVGCRVGYHFGTSIEVVGFENTSYTNLTGVDVSTRLGYKLTF